MVNYRYRHVTMQHVRGTCTEQQKTAMENDPAFRGYIFEQNEPAPEKVPVPKPPAKETVEATKSK